MKTGMSSWAISVRSYCNCTFQTPTFTQVTEVTTVIAPKAHPEKEAGFRQFAFSVSSRLSKSLPTLVTRYYMKRRSSQKRRHEYIYLINLDVASFRRHFRITTCPVLLGSILGLGKRRPLRVLQRYKMRRIFLANTVASSCQK